MSALELCKQHAKACFDAAEKVKDDAVRQQMRELAFCWQRLSDWAAEHPTPRTSLDHSGVMHFWPALAFGQLAPFLRHSKKKCLMVGLIGLLCDMHAFGG
jgi:hypothetical protein